ncbi:hypothetical protein D3C73_604550 [compost metagenome]
MVLRLLKAASLRQLFMGETGYLCLVHWIRRLPSMHLEQRVYVKATMDWTSRAVVRLRMQWVYAVFIGIQLRTHFIFKLRRGNGISS